MRSLVYSLVTFYKSALALGVASQEQDFKASPLRAAIQRKKTKLQEKVIRVIITNQETGGTLTIQLKKLLVFLQLIKNKCLFNYVESLYYMSLIFFEFYS